MEKKHARIYYFKQSSTSGKGLTLTDLRFTEPAKRCAPRNVLISALAADGGEIRRHLDIGCQKKQARPPGEATTDSCDVSCNRRVGWPCSSCHYTSVARPDGPTKVFAFLNSGRLMCDGSAGRFKGYPAFVGQGAYFLNVNFNTKKGGGD